MAGGMSRSAFRPRAPACSMAIWRWNETGATGRALGAADQHHLRRAHAHSPGLGRLHSLQGGHQGTLMNDPLDNDVPLSGSAVPADRLTESMLRFLDGQLTPEEQDALAQTLREQHDAREAFVDLCLDQAAIAEAAPTASDPPIAPPSAPPSVPAGAPAVWPSTTVVPMSPPAFWSLCAAVMVGLSLLMTLLWRTLGGSDDSRQPRSIASAGFDA